MAVVENLEQIVALLDGQVGKPPVVENEEFGPGEPIQLAVRARASVVVSTAQLPSSLASVEVHAGLAADYDALLGGVQ